MTITIAPMTVRFVADANFDHDFLRGLMRRWPDLDILTAQELGFQRTLDPDLLEWAGGKPRTIKRAPHPAPFGTGYRRRPPAHLLY